MHTFIYGKRSIHLYLLIVIASNVGFQTLSPISLCFQASPMHGSMISSILGLQPLGSSSTSPSQSQLPKMLPDTAICFMRWRGGVTSDSKPLL